MTYYKQRFVWMGVAVSLLVVALFGLAMMGSVAGAKPKNLPVALVVLDHGAELPAGGRLDAGEAIKAKLLGMKGLPVKWTAVATEEEARTALDAQSYYGALIIPADLSAGLLSLASPAPKPAVVTIMANEGMNAQAAAAVKQILHQAAERISAELSKQVIGVIGSQTKQVPVTAAAALLEPIVIRETAVHAVGVNNANGSAPVMLTQIMWMGSLVTSVFMFLAAKNAKQTGGRPFVVVSVQSLNGLLLTAGLSGLAVWMASAWYGMEIADIASVWLFLWLAAGAFFLLQSALLNVIGLPAMAILVLLLFFSIPVINTAPEFLPAATKDWLYAWTPFRFVTEGLRSRMYFSGSGAAAASSTVLAWLAAACFAIMATSGLRKPASKPQAVQSAA